MLEHFLVYTTIEGWLALITLLFLEIVLGIDNIVVISITSDRLPEHQQHIGRRLGLFAAMITRIILLVGIVWVMKLTFPLFHIGSLAVTGQGIILFVGGVYLIIKGFAEIKEMLALTEEREKFGHPEHAPKPRLSLAHAIAIIAFMDIVFSLDSVITAAGLSGELAVMIPAVIGAIIVMMVFADAISNFINHHPEIKLLALFFIFAIGVLLVLEAVHAPVSEWYVYFAMFFSLVVTLLQMRYKANLERMHREIREHQDAFEVEQIFQGEQSRD